MLSRDGVAATAMVMGFSFSGSGQNAALGFPALKDWSLRGKGQSASDEVAAFNAHFAGLADGKVMAVDPAPIDGLGNSGGFALRLQDRGGLGRDLCPDLFRLGAVVGHAWQQTVRCGSGAPRH